MVGGWDRCLQPGAKCIYLDKVTVGLGDGKERHLSINKGSNRPTPLMVQKGDGGYGYDSTDAAAVHHRLETLKNDCMHMVAVVVLLTCLPRLFSPNHR